VHPLELGREAVLGGELLPLELFWLIVVVVVIIVVAGVVVVRIWKVCRAVERFGRNVVAPRRGLRGLEASEVVLNVTR
jgi:hypothetical protein